MFHLIHLLKCETFDYTIYRHSFLLLLLSLGAFHRHTLGGASVQLVLVHELACIHRLLGMLGLKVHRHGLQIGALRLADFGMSVLPWQVQVHQDTYCSIQTWHDLPSHPVDQPCRLPLLRHSEWRLHVHTGQSDISRVKKTNLRFVLLAISLAECC